MTRAVGLLMLISGAMSAQRLVETVDLGAMNSRKTTRPVIRGTRYAVSSMEPLASAAAEQMLRSGGNAFDAIVAGQAVLGLVAPASNGIGGDAVLLVWDAKQKKAFSVNAEGTAPKLATIDWYRKNQNGKIPVNDTLLAGTVPGVMDAWYILLSRWGTRSFGDVLQTAIEMAEKGFPATESLASSITGSRDLRKYESSRKAYLRDGKVPRAGHLWTNPDLARTMRRLVEAEKAASTGGREAGLRAARDRFYKGDIAREMAAFSEANGGLFRYEDFAGYTALVEETASFNYRGYQVHKNPSANQGPAELFVLNLLEGYDLKALGHNSAAYIHTSVEALKLGFADRDQYLGDAEFIRIPWAGLLSKSYGEQRRKLIDPDRANPEFRPGMPEGGQERPRDVPVTGNADHEGDTSYIGVVDAQRNAISFTPSLHSGFGTKVVMAELGFSFNCRGDYYSLVEGHANALAPGKRPRSTLQGTLVTRDGEPFLITGSPGGDDQCMRTIQTFLNVVEFGMNIQQAIEAPRWTTRSFPASPFPHTMYPNDIGVESRIGQSVRAELVRKGHKMIVHGPWSMGSNAAILI
ncbi:MAG: gamma-glutamyltransferase family protein, partial [Acidobacteria bacterium]|nr:gamma-glutamyltransferase family protein [Acidobacteriota bacterium]